MGRERDIGIKGRDSFDAGRTLYATGEQPDFTEQRLAQLRKDYLASLTTDQQTEARKVLAHRSVRLTASVLERTAEIHVVQAAMEDAARGSADNPSDPANLLKFAHSFRDHHTELLNLAKKYPADGLNVIGLVNGEDSAYTAEKLHELSSLMLATSGPNARILTGVSSARLEGGQRRTSLDIDQQLATTRRVMPRRS